MSSEMIYTCDACKTEIEDMRVYRLTLKTPYVAYVKGSKHTVSLGGPNGDFCSKCIAAIETAILDLCGYQQERTA